MIELGRTLLYAGCITKVLKIWYVLLLLVSTSGVTASRPALMCSIFDYYKGRDGWMDGWMDEVVNNSRQTMTKLTDE